MSIDFNGKFAVVGIGEKFTAVFCRLKAKGNSLIAVVQNELAGTAPDEVDIELSQIIALIPDPTLKNGTVYGCKTEPWYKVEKVKTWGTVNYWRELSKYEEKCLHTAFTKVRIRLLEKFDLTNYICPLDIYIKPNRGMMIGSFRSRGEEKHDIITLCLKEWDDTLTISTLAHECGHKLWSLLSNRRKEQWIRYYTDGCSLKDITKQELESCRVDWVNSGQTVRDYSKQLEEENKRVFDAAIGYISDTYNLKTPFIDILLEQGEQFKDLWPKNPSVLSDIQGQVSDYSGKSPEELFCECVGLYTSKQPLPTVATKLTLKTLKNLR